MRLPALITASLFVALGIPGERAVANGIIVVPATTLVWVPKTVVVQRTPDHHPGYKGHLRRLLKPRAAPVYETVVRYEATWVATKVAISNPLRPCFGPHPTPQSPAPSPQAPAPPRPSPQSPDHAEPSAETNATASTERCGNCFPYCFRNPRYRRCRCCLHQKRDADVANGEAADILAKIARGEIRDYLMTGFWDPFVEGAIDDAEYAPDPIGPYPAPCPPPHP
jgi:hypothetical protein